ncbi:heavy-metal-associated domain-containing protein [Oceanihabitans sp. IOP_32]|uniref:heavy-metal-associated domain-containing protein n=1 Tax=Oceanihabitans sp. IOP_32 TaxID=2529032 RepID=UPI001293F1A8|nr:heavy metal-associated domain-containing protein [Oceanihabitans sp. IOP_32]QFZ54934.1 heavy-metal-associated domain-containing protein [Oceanihabitans sp. IOP_32]
MNTTLEIQNLKCGGCANTIVTRLNELTEISDVKVDNASNSVSFNHSTEAELETVTSLLTKLGYPVAGDKNALTTKAKSFVSCAVGRMGK